MEGSNLAPTPWLCGGTDCERTCLRAGQVLLMRSRARQLAHCQVFVEVAVADGVLPPKPEPMPGKGKGVFDGAPAEEIRRHGPRNGGRGSSRWAWSLAFSFAARPSIRMPATWCTRASWTCLEGFSERVSADTNEVIDVLKWPAVGTREKAWFHVLSRTQAEYHSLFFAHSPACRCDFLERGSFVSVAALALCL